MNQVILRPVPVGAAMTADASVSSGTKSAATDGTTPDGDVFRSTLAQLTASSTTAAARPAVPVAPEPQTPLEGKIAKMLTAGASQPEVITGLAAQLASSVAQALGTPGADARAELQALFASALAAPGETGAKAGSIADVARSLAQRFKQLETLASTMTGQQSGQQNRIAGKLLDAHRAKDIPARAATSVKPSTEIVAKNVDAQAGLAADVSAQAGLAANANAQAGLAANANAQIDLLANVNAQAGLLANVASINSINAAVPPNTSSAASGTGKRVGSPVRPLSMTHEASVPEARKNSVVPNPPSPDAAAATSTIVSTAPMSATSLRAAATTDPLPALPLPSGSGEDDSRTVNLGLLAATQTGGDTGLGRTLTRAALAADARPAPVNGDVSSTDAAASPAAPADVASDTAVASFVKAFAVALNADAPAGAGKAAQHDPQAGSTLLSVPLHEAANSSPAFVPSVAPFTIDRTNPAAASAPAAPVVPVDHSAIADQVLRGAFMRNVGQSSEMRLTLVPDSLGDVSVKLVVDAGNVTAHVVAETSEVRDALVAAQPQLTKSLADSGLKLTSFTVDLAGGGFTGFSGQNDQSQNGDRSRRSSNSAEVDGGDDTLLEAIPSFAPSNITKPSAGYYNYLA